MPAKEKVDLGSSNAHEKEKTPIVAEVSTLLSARQVAKGQPAVLDEILLCQISQISFRSDRRRSGSRNSSIRRWKLNTVQTGA